MAERARDAEEMQERWNRCIYFALLNQRNTPRDEVLGSPAQRLMSRRLKSTIPCADDLLKPEPFNGRVIKDRLNEKRQQQKFYDKQAKCLTRLKKDNVIRMQTNKSYNQLGFVIRPAERPRSLVVRSQGPEYQRNRRLLLRVAEPNPQSMETVVKPPISEETRAELLTKSLEKSEVSARNSNVITARSGRISKPNPKFNDYLM